MPVYNAKKAEDFWTQRVKGTNELAAVLSYSLPIYVNEAYSQWEIAAVLNSLPHLKGKTVLDLACGVGRVTVPLARQGSMVTAADNSEEMLRRCQMNVIRARLSRRVRWEKLNATALPYPDGSFDIVICLGLLEHLPPAHQKKAVAEIARVTKPGGVAILVINNAQSLFLQTEKRYNIKAQRKDGYFCGFIDQPAVESVLRRHGFTLQYTGSNYFQSVAKHSLRALFGNKQHDSLYRKFFEICADVDVKVAGLPGFNRSLADQFILKGEKSCQR